jgi:Rrf2 family cysteine metabolism transcriptional repressor
LRVGFVALDCSAVKLSVKSDYAARAVLALARRYQNGAATRAEDLAGPEGIPANYLVQILIELKSAHILGSQRGKDGGYYLSRPPGKITLGDVLRALHGEIFDSPAFTDPKCPNELRDAWLKLKVALEKTADDINFQRLLDATEDKGKMYYI